MFISRSGNWTQALNRSLASFLVTVRQVVGESDPRDLPFGGFSITWRLKALTFFPERLINHISRDIIRDNKSHAIFFI